MSFPVDRRIGKTIQIGESRLDEFDQHLVDAGSGSLFAWEAFRARGQHGSCHHAPKHQRFCVRNDTLTKIRILRQMMYTATIFSTGMRILRMRRANKLFFNSNSTQFHLVNSNSTSNLSIPIQFQFQIYQFQFRFFPTLFLPNTFYHE